MAEQNLLELAKEGNPKAIAVMLNSSLKAKNINAQVSRQDDCLQILVESAKIPDQKAIVSFIQRGLTNLGLTSITTVKVYSRRTGQKSPAWSQKFELASPVDPISDTEKIDIDASPAEPSDDVISRQFDPETEITSNERIRDSENYLPEANLYNLPRPAISEENRPLRIRQEAEQEPQGQRSIDRSNIRDRQPLKPLSVGNVLSAGIRLYRDHFKLYFTLACQAYLWIFIPIYGWAKCAAILALISRLAFSELTEQPETLSQARTHINRRMWSFLWAGILVGLIFSTVMFGLGIVLGLVFGIFGVGSALLGSGGIPNPGMIIVGILLGLITVPAFIFGYTWLYSRLSIVELPLAIEAQVNASSAIGRSWTLTKGFALRLVGIFMVAYLIMIPISTVLQIVISILGLILEELAPNSGILAFLYFLITLGLFIATAGLTIPFWQAIKAVIYYDLRTRREGLSLQLRNASTR